MYIYYMYIHTYIYIFDQPSLRLALSVHTFRARRCCGAPSAPSHAARAISNPHACEGPACSSSWALIKP